MLINTASTYKGGGVQVAKSFMEECKDFPQNEYHVLIGESLESMVDRKSFPENFTFYSVGKRPGKNFLKALGGNAFDRVEDDVKPDVVFTTSGPAYWRPRAPHLVGFNLGHYVYPDSPFYTIISLKPRVRWFLKKHIHSYFFKRDADAFVVQTEDVANRLRALFRSERVFVVPNTHSHDYIEQKYFPAKLGKKNGEIRLLTLCAYHLHKNLEIINAVSTILRKRKYANVIFVVTLDHQQFKSTFPEHERLGIRNVGPVPSHEGPALYAEVDFMFLPTLIECFSASYPEAMISKKPILTSDLGFARSVCQNAAVYFNPLDPEDIAEKIIKLIEQPQAQRELIKNGIERVRHFPDARARAAMYLNLCENLIEN